MKRLLIILLLGVLGYGNSNRKSVAVLEKMGAEFKRDEQGEIVEIDLVFNRVTDAWLKNLKGLTKLEKLGLGCTPISDAGLVYLEGLTNLEELGFSGTQVTDAGIAALQKALPKCRIHTF